MIYYPKSQIKENQYTNGGELQLISTKEEYKGYYYIVSSNKFFSGKNPQDKPSIELEEITSSELTEITSTDNSIEYLPSNYYIIDSNYYKSKKLSEKRNAPRPPIQTLGKPTDKDIQNGFFNRYFVKKGNEFKFIEISKEEYNKFKNQDTSVQWQLYIPTKIKWDIQGDREQVYNGNKTVVSLTEQRENLPGFTLFFRDQFDKFWIGR